MIFIKRRKLQVRLNGFDFKIYPINNKEIKEDFTQDSG
jgi:hypothetical protein